ncbi:MAG: urease accessory protein UreG [Eubacteriales bacterium]
MAYKKIGVAGPVGSGKTALIEAVTREMASSHSIGVITNDIYTKEDAEFLAKNSVMPRDRITLVLKPVAAPHTAIREDASMNLEAVDELVDKFPDIELVFIESGGDNLSATFSPELVDATIFVIDVAEGDKIPRKGTGITRSGFIAINKIELAPYVNASLGAMERDSKKMRGDKPFIFANVRSHEGVDKIIDWIKSDVLLEDLK